MAEIVLGVDARPDHGRLFDCAAVASPAFIRLQASGCGFRIDGAVGQLRKERRILVGRRVRLEERLVLRLLVGCMGYLAGERKFAALRKGESVVDGVLRALGGTAEPENIQAVRATLVLLADHELAPGSFAARVAASSGASLHGCLVSALCTNAGLRVGRVYDMAEKFLSSALVRTGWMKRLAELQNLGR